MDNFGWLIILIAVFGGIGKLLGLTRAGSDHSKKKMKRPQFYREVEADQPVENDLQGNQPYESMKTNTDESLQETYSDEDWQGGSYSREYDHPYERETASPNRRDTPKPYTKKANRTSNPFRHLTKEQLREGIVLAEVLSEKPRAKNPHPSVARYRHPKS